MATDPMRSQLRTQTFGEPSPAPAPQPSSAAEDGYEGEDEVDAASPPAGKKQVAHPRLNLGDGPKPCRPTGNGGLFIVPALTVLFSMVVVMWSLNRCIDYGEVFQANRGARMGIVAFNLFLLVISLCMVVWFCGGVTQL